MTTKRFATRDFKDAGTDRQFKKGDELTVSKDLTEAQIANYEAAGLVGDKAEAEPAKASGNTDKVVDKTA